jgi:hypothetical protein
VIAQVVGQCPGCRRTIGFAFRTGTAPGALVHVMPYCREYRHRSPADYEAWVLDPARVRLSDDEVKRRLLDPRRFFSAPAW